MHLTRRAAAPAHTRLRPNLPLLRFGRFASRENVTRKPGRGYISAVVDEFERLNPRE